MIWRLESGTTGGQQPKHYHSLSQGKQCSLIQSEDRILNIRKATRADIDFLASVMLLANEQRLSLDASWNAEDFTKQARASTEKQMQGEVKNSTTYVIEFQGTSVGRLRVIRTGHEIHIAGIQVLPEHQQRGIGSSVMHEIIKEANTNAQPLTLEIEKDNPDAKRLYERLGFKVTEDRKDRELMALLIG